MSGHLASLGLRGIRISAQCAQGSLAELIAVRRLGYLGVSSGHGQLSQNAGAYELTPGHQVADRNHRANFVVTK